MKTHTKITISVPKELDRLIERIVKESKDTPKPMTKSSLFVVAVYEYLREATKILKAINSKEEN